MALFGGSKSSTSNTSKQLGVETEGDVAQIQAEGDVQYSTNFVNEFPDAVSTFASNILGFTRDVIGDAFGNASDVIGSSQGQSAAVLDSISTIAEREKTPLTEWLPFVAVGAAGLVALAFFSR